MADSAEPSLVSRDLANINAETVYAYAIYKDTFSQTRKCVARKLASQDSDSRRLNGHLSLGLFLNCTAEANQCSENQLQNNDLRATYAAASVLRRHIVAICECGQPLFERLSAAH